MVPVGSRLSLDRSSLMQTPKAGVVDLRGAFRFMFGKLQLLLIVCLIAFPLSGNKLCWLVARGDRFINVFFCLLNWFALGLCELN